MLIAHINIAISGLPTITISLNSTLPSLVSLMPPAPSTNLECHGVYRISTCGTRALQVGKVYLHFDGASGAQVGLEHILQTDGSSDVELECLTTSSNVRVGVDHFQGRGRPDGAPTGAGQYSVCVISHATLRLRGSLEPTYMFLINLVLFSRKRGGRLSKRKEGE